MEEFQLNIYIWIAYKHRIQGVHRRDFLRFEQQDGHDSYSNDLKKGDGVELD